MGDEPIWQPLHDLLQRIAEEGRNVAFWLRDDDAIEPTPALDRLLELTSRFAVPLGLAVIPAFTGRPLVDRLRDESHTTVLVHGWSHENHAAGRGKKCELGGERPQDVVLGELRDGLDKLKTLYPAQLEPMLVPPWNRVAKALLPQLPASGFKAISVYGEAERQSPIKLVNTHVDIMDWVGTRGCRPHSELVAVLMAELERRISGSDEPIGVLTHHLVHDDACWDFMAKLFEATAGSGAVRWHRVRELMI